MTTFTTAQGEMTLQEIEAVLAARRFEDASSGLDNEERDPITQRIITKGNDDSSLIVEFFTKKVKDEFATLLNNDVLVEKELEFLTIAPPQLPDGVDRTVTQPVNEYYKKRFPKDYYEFKMGLRGLNASTPLSSVSNLTSQVLEELANHRVTTVQQLLNLPDSKARMIPGCYDAKAKAKMHLDDLKNSSTKSEIEALKAQMAEMAALLEKSKKIKPSESKDTAE